MSTPRSSREAVRGVIAALARGQQLQLHFRNGAAHWSLTSGARVPDAVARAVVAHPAVAATDTGLFPDAPPQTWRLRSAR